MIEKGSILTLLDNNEYVLMDRFTKDGNIYCYLVDINNHTNFIYGKLENDEIVEISNPDELEMVIKIVNENLHNEKNIEALIEDKQ